MKAPSKSKKSQQFWKAVVGWVGIMVGVIVASFIYSAVKSSYHNPFFDDPVRIAIALSIVTVWYWCWGWGRRYIRDVE